MPSIHLVLVTTHDLVRSGIRLLIQATPDIDLMQDFPSVIACSHYLQQHRATVLLLDDALTGPLSPSQALAVLHDVQPSLHIIVLSDDLSTYYVQRLLEQGAAGFIYKSDRLEDTLVVGIKTVVDGHIFLSPQASSLPYERLSEGPLNRTDLEVLQLMARGFTVQEISQRVGIVDRSVYRIRHRLRRYLGVRTNEQIVEAARRCGLLKAGDRTASDRI